MRDGQGEKEQHEEKEGHIRTNRTEKDVALRAQEILGSAFVIYRLSIFRVDNLIDSWKFSPLRDFLMSHRQQLHEMIDECIRARKRKESMRE